MATRIRRTAAAMLAAVLVLGAVSGCQRKVEVETGDRVLCAYGHTVVDTVKTIEVPAKDAGKYTVATRTITCEVHAKAQALYSEGQDAIEAGDLKTAEKALTEVAALDPAFRKAGEQLSAIRAGKKPTVDRDTSAPGGTPAPGDAPNPGDATEAPNEPSDGNGGEVTGPIASLSGWMPNELAGFNAEKINADALFLTRDYVSTKNPNRILVIAAEQMISTEEAKTKVAALERAYSQSGRSMKIGGNTAYVGSNGRGVATLGIADGPAFIALQLTDDSAKPSALVSALTKIAEGLPK